MNQFPKTLREAEKDHIISVCIFTNGTFEKVYRILEIGRCTLYRKLKKYNIDINLYRNRAKAKPLPMGVISLPASNSSKAC
jgi:DNA-binding NtrC family response regulator